MNILAFQVFLGDISDMAKVKTRQFSWKALVESVEGKEKPPVVYRLPGGRSRVDSGPRKGIYEQ